MALRFRKSKSFGNTRLTVTKRGMSVSTGVKGMRVGVGSRGGYTSVGIPGTGLYALNYLGKGSKGGAAAKQSAAAPASNLIDVPKEMRTPISVWLILLASLILLFIKPIISLFGVLAAIAIVVNNNSKPANRNFLEGRKALVKNDYKTALERFETVLEHKPHFTFLYSIMGNLGFKLQRYDEAIGYYQKHDRIMPNDHSIKINYSTALASTGQFEEGIKVLQSLPSDIKENVRVITLMGLMFLEMGKPELAIATLEKGPMRKRSMDEQMMMFRYALGITYKKDGQIRKAVKQLQKVYAEQTGYLDVKELLEEMEEELESKRKK